MRKVLIVMLCAFMFIAMLAGCGSTAPVVNENALYKAGTYDVEVDGHNDKIKLQVVVDDSTIKEIKIVGHKESAGISDAAFEKIPKAIIDGQTLAVDTVSGATVSSKAIIAGVTEALTQAGADVEALKNKTAATTEDKSTREVISKEVDVVVVGGGGAGLSAAATVIENNGSVIVLEKMPALGGNTVRAGGAFNAHDPELQKAQGIEDSFEQFYEDTFKSGDEKADPALVKILTQKAGEARNWIIEQGGQFKDEIYMVTGSLKERARDPLENSQMTYINPLKKKIEDSKNEILLNTKATELIIENDKVVGVKAEDTETGQQYIVKGKNGVILASGGYSANEEMVAEFNNAPKLISSNHSGATGDGIVMAKKIGAELVGMEYIQIHPRGNPKSGLIASYGGNATNSIYVNKDGDRFIDEQGRRDVVANSILEQPDKMMYTIYDSESAPKSAEENVTKGNIIKADTIEDLAKAIGCDPAKLKTSVDRYNTLVDGGKDLDFNKAKLEKKITKAPFYAVNLVPTIHHTMGGIKIDTQAKVINTAGKPIEGLYAAGEVTGGIHGTNRVGGNAMADTVVFGRIAGQSAMGK
ncbi:flavocytochrome c [Brevibacillus daliensis]|uniref:flavocytochrome c n=1 Tax=Brevibacillus daliensis TaxID=2892995 RepID=UPI001E5E0D5F|nr:flavocytochrome c [Brevibacillus daliensis]